MEINHRPKKHLLRCNRSAHSVHKENDKRACNSFMLALTKWHQTSLSTQALSKLPNRSISTCWNTVYPKKYAHGFVVLYFVVVMQSFIMNSHEVFIHIHQGCFAGTGAIVRLPQCQRSKLDGYGKISQCITTTKHSKAKTVCIFLGIYCRQLTNRPNIKASSYSTIPSKSSTCILSISRTCLLEMPALGPGQY